MRVAKTLLQPWAMLAKGPPWTKQGVPSRVCTRLGMRASFKSASTAPVAFKSPAVTGLPSKVKATKVRSMRRRRSS